MPSDTHQEVMPSMIGNVNTDFYDSMLKTSTKHKSMNLVERTSIEYVLKTLNNKAKLSGLIPALPEMLICLLDALSDPNADVFTFVEIIEKDPSFAAEVLKMANTAKYNHTDSDVVHLRKATSFLGLSGLMKIASTLLMADVIPCQPVHYQLYGKLIWVHSVQCATLCEMLAKDVKENQADAYFLGLIHDLGRIIIFNCLSEAMGESFADFSPCSYEYKVAITKLSLNITCLIAKEWQLPSIYVEALLQQKSGDVEGLGELLYKANRLSENYLLLLDKAQEDENHIALKEALSISDDTFEKFCDLAPKIADSVE